MGAKIMLGLGIGLALYLFIFINQTLGCYHVGQFAIGSFCFKPAFYRGVWVLAFALIGFGGWRVFRASNKAKAPQ